MGHLCFLCAEREVPDNRGFCPECRKLIARTRLRDEDADDEPQDIQ
jgi:hypothetical protein